MERLNILKGHLVNVEASVLDAFIRYRKNGVALDDVLDAMVVALTAKLANSKLLTLPPHPAQDDEGLSMEIVYALP